MKSKKSQESDASHRARALSFRLLSQVWIPTLSVLVNFILVLFTIIDTGIPGTTFPQLIIACELFRLHEERERGVR
jgi:hypothetical protein